MNPFVSVVLTTYNRKHIVSRSIDSILNQTYKNLELIIVDDASTDDTLDLITEQYGDDDRIIYVLNDQNLGPSGARNAGIAAAHGEWIAFQDSDDIWHTDKLEKQMRLALSADTNVGMIYSQVTIHWQNGTTDTFPSNEVPAHFKSGNIHPYVLINPLCATPTMLIRKNCLDEVGGFATDIYALDDYELSIRVSRKYQVLLCNEPLVEAYESSGSIGKQNDEKIRVQCMILDYYKDSLTAYGLKEKKVQAIWLEASFYGNLPVFEKYFLELPVDSDYVRAYFDLKIHN